MRELAIFPLERVLDEAEHVLQPRDHRFGVHAMHGRIETRRISSWR
jgi:hypothetical protein